MVKKKPRFSSVPLFSRFFRVFALRFFAASVILGFMGRMNLLTASFDGKVGAVYGSYAKGAHKISAVPFSHAPHNKAQKDSFSAFGCLNRFSAGVAPVFFPYMGISDKKMLKHNAVAKLWKASVAGHFWALSRMAEVVPPDGTCAVDSFVVDTDAQQITLSASTSGVVDKAAGAAWCMGICDARGRVLACRAPDSAAYTLQISAALADSAAYAGFAFRADRVFSRVKLHGWAATETAVITGGVWYTSLMPGVGSYAVSGGVLSVPRGDISVDGDKIILNV